VCALLFAWASDKTRLRAPFLAILTLVTIVGLVLTAFNHHPNVRYTGKSRCFPSSRVDPIHVVTGIFFTLAGACSSIPGILAYVC
jgi:hypothetical protein